VGVNYAHFKVGKIYPLLQVQGGEKVGVSNSAALAEVGKSRVFNAILTLHHPLNAKE
jgi:hypothetical protein